MNPSSAINRRPGAITAAAIIFMVNNALTILIFLAKTSPHRPVVFVVRSFAAAAVVTLFLVPLLFAFQGKNWARWVIAAMQLLGLLLFHRALHRVQTRPHWELWNLYFQTGVELIATALLFLPISNQWFHRQPPTPTPPCPSTSSPSRSSLSLPPSA